MCVWINGWVNNREAGDLRRYRTHYDVTVMQHFADLAKSFPCSDDNSSLTFITKAFTSDTVRITNIDRQNTSSNPCQKISRNSNQNHTLPFLSSAFHGVLQLPLQMARRQPMRRPVLACLIKHVTSMYVRQPITHLGVSPKKGLSSILRFMHFTMTSKWARWRLKSPASPLFTQPFIQTHIKENIEAPRHWPWCREFIGDRWIPCTNGQ